MLCRTAGASNAGVMSEREAEGKISGFIFLCNGETKPECYRYRVFGLPQGKLDVVEKIEPGTMLFLFDFGVKLLYGLYTATSKGEMNLEPAAFRGKFPAQVRFKISGDCLPLPEQAFRHAIKDNYMGSKFRQELSSKQVKALVSLFKPIDISASVSQLPTATTVPVSRTFATPRPNESHALETYNRAHVQMSTTLQYAVEQTSLPFQPYPYRTGDAPHSYLPQKAPSSTYDPNRSYEVAIEMDRMSHVHGLGNQHYLSQLTYGRDTVNSDSYYGQYPHPTTTSRVPLQAQAFAPSYTYRISSNPQALPSTYQSYYSPPTCTDQGPVYVNPLQDSMLGNSCVAWVQQPVSSSHSYTGAAAYQL